jgi:hypothetical protein
MSHARRFLVLTALALVVFGSYFVYKKFFQIKGEIVLLSPEDIQYIKRPDDPGGIVVPHSSSLIYEKLKKNKAINRKITIIPETEIPLLLDNNDLSEVQYLDSIDQILANIELYEDQIKTDALQEDDVLPNKIMPEAYVNNSVTNQEKRLEINDFNTDLNVIISSNSSKIKRMDLDNVTGKGYKLQLSQASSATDAAREWGRIKKKNNKILSDVSFIAQKVEGKNKRIFYLVMAGYYQNLNQAKLVCKKLLRQKQNCIVTK